LDKFSQPKKSLGQHFLNSPSYCRRIAVFSGLRYHETVVEVGAGTGQLTSELLRICRYVVAVELDPDMLVALRQRFFSQAETSPSLELIEADVLQLDWVGLIRRLEPSHPSDPAGGGTQPLEIRVIGNLPYNIATRIMTSMTRLPYRFQSLTFMTQKEVARRVLACAGSEDYCYLSVLMDYHFERNSGFDVPAGAFPPPPKVISHVFRLTPRPEGPGLPPAEYNRFLRLIQAAFRHRRKKLKNNLKELFPDHDLLEEALSRAGIDPGARPQEIGLEQFLRLQRVLSCSHE